MEQRSNDADADAAVKDAQIMLRMEECATSTEQRSNYVAVKDAQIKLRSVHKHGAKVRRYRCSREGCTNQTKRGGVCWRHGAYRNAQDESTAFRSEYERTTATQTLPNQRTSRSSLSESGRRSVPGEVTILCQEIVEV